MSVRTSPALAVIVPATDAPRTLPRCIAAIRAATAPGDELIVVEDAAERGPAHARNQGVAAARAEILVFVDADVEIRPGALPSIRDRFAADPDLAAVFGAYDDDPAERDVVST